MTVIRGVVNDDVAAFNAIVNAGWPTAWQISPDELVIAGPGGTGRKVYLGIRRISIPATATYGMQLFGMNGVNANVTRLEDHINCSPAKFIFLDNTPMNYWITIDDHRIIATFQVSGKFFMIYAGMILPFTTPDVYPYPYLMSAPSGYLNASINSWRSEDSAHSLIQCPSNGPQNVLSGSALMDPTGIWRNIVSEPYFYNNDLMTGPDGPGRPGDPDGFGVSPDRGLPVRQQRDRIGKTIDGGVVLRPLTIIDPVSDQVYGTLNGLYQVPGRNVKSPDIETVDGVDHLVIQNVFRTGYGQFAAQQLS